MTARTLPFVLAALLGALAAPAAAAPSYDGCTGFIPAVPIVLATQGTWCMNKDLATAIASGAAITVQANNVTIDCNGFKLGGLAAGVATQTIGVRSVSRLNLTIRGCRIRGFLTGISITGDPSGGHLVEGNVIEGSTLSGLELAGSGSVIRGNRIVDTGGSTFAPGLAIGMTVNGTVDIVDNAIVDVFPSDIDEMGSANTYGIRVTGGQGLRIAGNQIRAVGASGLGIPTAISMSGTSRSDISGNFIVGSNQGVFCGATTDLVHGNHLSGFGVPVWGCSTLSENLVVD